MTAEPKPKPPPRRVSRKPPIQKKVPPPPQCNGRAVTNGARANPLNLPGFDETEKMVAAVVARADWLIDTDGLLPEILTCELHNYRYTHDYLARLTPTARSKKLNAEKIQLRRVKLIGEICDRLGLTPQARLKMGLTQARTERERVRAQPVRTEERARQVAEMLARAGVLPPLITDAQVVEEGDAVPDTDDGVMPPRHLRLRPEEGGA